MNCGEFDALLLDLVREEAASSAREEGRAHAAGCARCAALLSEQRRLSAGLKALAVCGEEDHAPQRIESALRAEFRRQAQAQRCAVEEPQGAGLESAFRIWRSRWAWALAAIVIAVAGGVMAKKLLLKPRVTTLTQTQPQLAAQPTAPRPAVVAVTNPQPLGGRSATRGAARRRDSLARVRAPSRPAARAQKPSNEWSTNFYPLPYSSGLDLDEGWEIVRLNMPVSALVSLGVPVMNEGSSAQYVTADVVLGGDGMARAIRFVQ